MANQDTDRVTQWHRRINNADTLYRTWENKYKINALDDYYEGFQWQDYNDSPYTLNLFYSTIETKMPSLIFDNPSFIVAPSTEALASDPEESFKISANLQDSINNWIADIHNNFQDEVEAAMLDCWNRFGIIEAGYSADWIDNPNVRKPEIKPNGKSKKYGPSQIPVNERAYVRYIPAKTFRVSTDNKRYLHLCDWCGYSEFVRVEDLRANKLLKNVDKLDFSGARMMESGMGLGLSTQDKDFLKDGEYTLIWKIWDTRSKMRCIISGVQDIEFYYAPYKIFPFEEIRWRKPLRGYYPVPTTFNWVSPQNEINESRESNRTHRRRFRRMYMAVEGAVDTDEVSKLINGPDGGIISVSRPDAIQPIQNADLGSSHAAALQVSKDDFNIISGTTAEQRGEADRVTATQASITNQRAIIRESREKTLTANFYCRIAKKILLIIKNQFVNQYSVMGTPETSDRENILGAPAKPEPRNINPLTDLGEEDFDFNVTVSIETMSPVANEQEMKKFLMFLSLLQQYQVIAMSPILIRECAFRVGYRNEKVIEEFQKMAQLQMLGQLEMGMKNMQGSNAAQNMVAKQTPTNMDKANEQLRANSAPGITQ